VPILRLKSMLVAQMGKRAQIAPYGEHHVASPAPVPARRPPHGNIFLPPEGRAAIPARTGGHLDSCLVGKSLHVRRIAKN
jgi:hypothetical protein